MNNRSCVIVIPFHKGYLSINETNCLNSLLKNYSHSYKISFLIPEGVNISDKLNETINNFRLSINFTHKNSFSTYYNYNVFLTSQKFYELYLNYKFVLIYQLDVLSHQNNNLEIFLKLNLDYIGPIIFRVNPDNSHSVILVGGNGGISLRNVETHYRISKKIFFFNLHKYYKITGYKCTITSDPFKYIFKKFISRLICIIYYKKIRFKFIQEDVFWSCIVPSKFKKYSVSNNQISAQFGFDMLPSYSFKLNNNKLPLFFHAFQKNNDGFYNTTNFKNILN